MTSSTLRWTNLFLCKKKKKGNVSSGFEPDPYKVELGHDSIGVINNIAVLYLHEE